MALGRAMAADPITSLSIHTSTLRMLRPFKRGDMTWDDVLLDFIEEHVPKEFIDAMVHRAEHRPHVSLAELRRRSGL
jgi:mRNA-degrading endonuclease RelE of RelBE toxin-antitoxin system